MKKSELEKNQNFGFGAKIASVPEFILQKIREEVKKQKRGKRNVKK